MKLTLAEFAKARTFVVERVARFEIGAGQVDVGCVAERGPASMLPAPLSMRMGLVCLQAISEHAGFQGRSSQGRT